MEEMTESEWRSFLLDQGRTAKLATVQVDGGPHVTPIWFDLDDRDILFTTHATSAKGKAIARDPRVALCVDDETPPFAYVLVEGEVSVTTDLDLLLTWATRIGGRYMGADRAEEYGRRNGVPGELLVRIRPTKVVARRGIAD